MIQLFKLYNLVSLKNFELFARNCSNFLKVMPSFFTGSGEIFLESSPLEEKVLISM